jgi:spore coat polysaccharide biosynthesis predicted glycosyltransferase SpsG
MRVVIRCDVGGHDGYGHARRMLGLARALQVRGAAVAFASQTPALAPMIAPFEVWGLRSGRADTAALLDLVGLEPPDVLVIDKRADWSPGLWAPLRQACRVVRVDHPDADADSCDLLLIPNCHQSPEAVARLSQDFEDRLCYGAPYVLLDADLDQWRRHRWGGWAANRLVFLVGGVDPTGALQQFLDLSERLAPRLPQVWLVYAVGQAQAQALKVRGLADNQAIVGFHPRFLMGAALWVGLFGVMVYNALALGVPMITVGHTATNTQASQWLMAATSATLDLGFLGTLGREAFTEAVVDVWHDAATRQQMGKLGRQLIDGQGAQRCAEAILALGG